MDDAPILSARDLGHAYGSIVALHGVEFDLPAGRTGLVGANGAGKTTLIKILLGILRPTTGSATVLGFDATKDMLDIRSRIGYMPESDCLPLDVTASEFIVYAAGLAGLPPNASRQRSSDVLTLVGVEEERFRPLGGFSTGMKQRTKLAQAIVHDPELVLLDEPTAGLDPEGREEMLELISRLGGFGINVLVSSHVLGDIERTCDWVLMLDGGRVLRSGPLAHLVDADVVSVDVLGDISAVIGHLRAAGATVDTSGSRLLVSSSDDDPFRLVRDALATTGSGMRSLGPKATTLEDVFLEGSGA
ncbi:MAG: ABC transporter ATP-binding protein [Actinomycetota bacterium]|nr:ABC transporter ATP-binding protein [Actinomycetota bacterium]